MFILYSQFFQAADADVGIMVGAIAGEGGCSMELVSSENRNRDEREKNTRKK